MPGPVSDSYDPEWGTSSNADRIREALSAVYGTVSGILKHSQPFNIMKLLDTDLPTPITATLTENQWRMIRFALERAEESV